MNKIHRVVWNESSGAWVAVSEIARAHSKTKSTLISAESGVADIALWVVKPVVLALALALAGQVYAVTPPVPQPVGGQLLTGLAGVQQVATTPASTPPSTPPSTTQLPTGGQVVAGQASIQQTGASLNITETSNQAAINWQTFNLGSQAQVNFIQPSSSSAILNRVLDPNPSQIFGHISANGQVFLTNASGIYFSPTSSVDVGSFTATTHSISDADFMAGNYRFTRDGATGSIVNDGKLKSGINGYIALLAPEVRNNGVIVAQMGTVALAAGEVFELQFDGNNTLASLRVTPTAIKALVDNRSAVLAPGGLIILSARAVDQLQGGVINNSGAISASSLVSKGGRILLEGDAITLKSGSSLSATGVSDGTAGAVGGGTVLVGGDWQGSGAMHQATTVTMEQGASIDASASGQGDGGKVVLWSDVSNTNSQTTANGSITARGGANGGNGGQVETSGHNVNVGGIRVDAGADKGTGGLWLIDPTNSTIDQAVADSYKNTLDGGTSVLDDVSGNIVWNSGVTLHKTAGTAATLTLRTSNSGGTESIALNSATIDSTSNALNLVLWTRYDGASGNDSRIAINTSTINTNGGNLWMGGGTTGSLWNGLNVGSGAAQAAAGGLVGVNIQGSSISTGAGNIFMNGLSNVSATNNGALNFGLQVSQGSSITTTSGQIDMTGGVTGTYSTGTGLVLGNLTTTAGNVTVSSGSGTINLAGNGSDLAGSSNSWRHGLMLIGGNAGDVVTVKSNSGTINLTGTGTFLGTLGTTDSSGIQLQNNTVTSTVDVVSTTGNINLYASNTLESSQYLNALRLSASNAANSIRIGYDGSTAYSGNILIQGNSLLQHDNNAGAGSIAIQSTGTLTFQSLGSAFTQLRAGAAGTLSFDDDWNFGTTLGGFTLGKSTNTSDVTLSNALSVNGPISLYGGQIALNANLTSTGTGDINIIGSTNSNTGISATGTINKTGGGDSTLTVRSNGRINLGGAITDTSASGKLNVVLWSDYGNNNLGGVSGVPSITTKGGHVWIGGSNTANGSTTWNGLTVGDGPSVGSGSSNNNAIDLLGAINTSNGASGGDVYIWGGAPYGAGSSISGGATPSIAAGSGNVTLRGNTFSWTTPFNITNTGAFTFWSGTGTLTADTGSLGQGTDLSYFKFNANPSAFTWGGSGNTQNVTLDGTYNSTLTVAGPISIYGGNITLNNNLTSTASGADILLKASAGIVQAASVAVTSNGGDITYWANSTSTTAAPTTGGVYINDGGTIDSRTTADRTASNTSTATGGGTITLGGGSASTTLTSGTVVPTGYAQNISGYSRGIGLGTDSLSGHDAAIHLYSGGGDITLRGQDTVTGATAYRMGVGLYRGVTIDAGLTGNLTIEGICSGGTNTRGMEFNAFASTAPLDLLKTGNGNITINGNASGASGDNLAVIISGTVEATGSGGITITGTSSGTSPYDIDIWANVLAHSGAINITGLSTGTFYLGGTTIGRLSASDVTSSSSNVTLSGNHIAFDPTASTVDTSGTLTMQPYGSDFTTAFSTQYLSLANTISGLTIGKSATSADGTSDAGVTIYNAASIAGPVNIYGGNLTINSGATLASTAGTQGILLKSSGSITDSANLTTSGGDITLWANSAGTAAGGIQLNNGVTLSSSGGAITLGGGFGGAYIPATSANGTALPQGYAASNTGSGISLGTSSANTTTINSGGGDVNIIGESTASSGVYNFGVESYGALNINSANGAIVLTGLSSASYGVEFSGGLASGTGLTLTSSKPSGIAISLLGDTFAASSTYGLVFNNNSSKYVEATGGGAIYITGNGSSSSYGLFLSGTNVLASTGTISLDGGTGGITFAGPAGTLGKLTSAGVGSSSSNITLTGGAVNVGVATTVDTSGTLTVQPSGYDFTTAFTMQNMTLGSTVSGLTLGKSATSADGTSDVAVTISSATSVAGPINIYGSNITLNSGATLTSTAGTQGILLKGSGSITDNANLITNGGDITLWSNATNGGGTINIGDGVTVDSRTNADRTASNTSTASGGGTITMGGGSASTTLADSTVVPTGYALQNSGTLAGVEFGTGTTATGGHNANVHLYSGGGNITARGNATVVSSTESNGILAWEGLTIDAGTTGGITLAGQASTGTYSSGIYFGYHLTGNASTLLRTFNGNISLTGTGTGATNNRGIVDGGGSTYMVTAEATGTGSVTLSGSGSNYDYSLYGANILAASGPITLNGSASGLLSASSVLSTIGYKSGSAVTASTSNVTISEDNLSLASGAGLQVNSAGAVVVESNAAAFGSTVDLTNLGIGGSPSSVRIGKTTNTANVTLGSAISAAGPIHIYGGNIILNAGLATTNTTTGSIDLTASGGVSGSGNIGIANGEVLTITQAGNSTYSGVISGTGSSFTNAGSGSLVLTGANSYTGATNVNAGALTIRPPNYAAVTSTAINVNGASALTFDSLGRLDLSANTVISFDSVGGGSVDFTGIQNGGGVTMTPGDVRIVSHGGAQDVIKSTTGIGLNTNSSTLTLDVGAGGGGLLVNSNLWNHGALIKNGSGTATLSGTSDYGGGTSVNVGVLQAGVATTGSVSNGPFGTGTVTVNSGAAVDVNGKTIANAFSIAGSGVGSSGAIYNSTGTAATLNGAITLAADATINSTAGASLTLGGAINGGHALTVTTAGTSDGAYTQNGIVGGATPLSSYTVNSGAAAVSLAGASTVAGPIIVQGGPVTLSGNLTSSATTGTGVSLTGSGIAQGQGVNVSTSGANIDYLVNNAAFTASDNSAIGLYGVSGSHATINANGGNVTLNASFAASGTPGGGDDAVHAFYTDISTTGTGAISITADATNVNNTSTNAWGAFLGYVTAKTDSGAINLTGIGGYASSNSLGIVVNGQDLKLLSNSGQITVKDPAPSGLTGSYGGLYLNPSSAANIVIGADGSTVPSSTSNITISADKVNFLANGAYGTRLNTAGAVVVESNAATFGSAANLTSLAITGSPSSVRVGKTTNTADVTLGSAISAAGPISIYGGNLNLNASLSSTASGAGILLEGSGNIVQAASTSVTTNGGAITFWADSDANGGAIYLNDGTTLDSRTTSDRSASRTSTATGGGAITLGGGSAGTTAPTGYAWQTSTNTSAGVTFGTYTAAGHNANVKLYSGGGDIAVRGKATAGANTLAVGIQSFEGLTVDAGTSGSISFDGLATGNGTAAGLDLQAWRTGSASSLLRTQNGSIAVTGTASGGSAENIGINMLANTGGTLTIEATGSGGVSLVGSASGTLPTDIRLGNTNLLAASGPISITGANAGALVTLKQGASNYANAIGSKTGSDVTASTSNVVITDDSLSLAASNGFQVNTSGTLVLQPQANNFTSTLDTTNLALASTLTGLTLGRDIGATAHTDTITVGSAASIAGPINIYAGNINLNAGLTTTNTSTGAVNLTASGGVSGSGNIGLAGGEALTITQAGNSSYGGVISGTGSSFTNAGVGTLTLTGHSTYSGTTTLSAGTLQLGNNINDGTLAGGDIVNNANLAFDWYFAETAANAISGSGNVSMIGNGVAILTGNNSYAGTTTVSSGTIQVGNGGTSGSLGGGNVIDNSVLKYSRSDSLTVANAVSGTGSLWQIGGGTLILTGTNSYGNGTTISAGTLQIGNGGTSGSVGSGTVTDSGNLTFDRSDVTTFANVINGSGSLTQLGSGTTVLSNMNGYTGLTTVSAGTLGVSNFLGLGGTSSGVTVASGATLDLQAVAIGNKSVTLNGGSLATSVGTSSLAGNVALGADSNVNVGGTQLTLSGIVSGATYGVTTGGSGTLIFTGANTYGGTTTINAGSLQVGAAGTVGSLGSGSVVDNASLVFNRSDALSVANDISGSGSLTQMGTGVLTVSGNNSFSGGVNLSAGSGSTLSLGSSGALGTAGSISFGGGILQYSSSNTTDYSSRFSSAASQAYKIDTNSQNVTLASALGSTGGTLTKFGAGTLILSGTNNYSGSTTVSSGVLQIGNGGTSGSLGTAGVTDNASLVFNRSDAVSVANVISGSGSVTQQGGTLTLTTNDSYTGATTISSGALVLQNDAPTTASSGFSGAGTLTIQSASASFGGGFNNSGWNFGSSLGGLTIGKTTNSQSVTVGNAVSIAGPINIYGGAIALSHNLSSAATTGTGISLNGSSVTQASGVAVATSGANIEYLVSNAPWTSATDFGLNLNGVSGSLATLNANGGNINLSTSFASSGTDNTSTNTDRAIRANYASMSTTGTGAITLTGDASSNASATNTVWGIQLYNTTIQSASGAINIAGTGGKATGNSRGFAIDTSPVSILSNSGAISINDLQPSGLTGTYAGMYFMPTPSANIYIGANGSTVASSSSNVSLLGDVITFAANAPSITQINTSGTVAVQSNAAGFSSPLNMYASGLSVVGTPSSVTIGKTSNTADVTLGTAINAAGPINIYGGNITLNAALSATGTNTISLTGTGNVSEGAAGYVSADKLALLGGNVTLNNANNAIGTLAANGVSGLSYTDSNALTIGTVGSSNGVSATGAVSIGAATGDLTLAQNVATTNATSSALVLNAGINTVAGTATGGNIVLSGNPTVSVGNGGRATLYTGSLSGSTGLSGLVGLGSGHFRYNADETTNFASGSWANLGSGVYGVYREQPTISTIAVNDQTITYGDATPTWTYSITGSQNGDTLAQAFSGGPSVTVGGSTSTSGNYTAGTSHTITASGSLGTSLLGYANTAGSYTAGALTVGQKTLTVVYTGIDKTYDGSTNATVNTSDNRIANDVLTISSTAAFVDKNAANNVAVNVTGASLSNTDAANYTLASTSGSATANITKATVGLSASKTYDGTMGLSGDVSITTGIAGETLTYSGATASDVHVATAGKYISAMSLVDQLGATTTSGGLASNYQLPALDAAHAPVTIGAAPLSSSASIGGTLSKSYSGTTVATGATVSGSVNGAVPGDTLTLDVSGVTLAYNSAHVVGANSISANGSAGFSIASSASGSLTSDYSFSAPSIATATGTSITPATLTLSLANTGVTKTYDGTVNAPVGFTPVWNLVGFVTGDTAAGVSSTGAAYNSKNVLGASKITVSGASLSSITGSRSSATSDYALAATSVDVAATITPATVGLSASKTYDGTTDLTGAVSITTGIAGETLTYTGATANDAHVATVGKYISALTLADQTGATSTSGGLASNYQLPALDAANAPVSISTKTLIPSASIVGTLSKPYDGNISANSSTASIGGSVGGAVNGDTLTLDASGVSLAYDNAHVATANQIGVAGGTVGYSISSSVGSLASDYSFSAPTIPPVTAHITPATLTPTLTNTGVSKVYDGSTDAPSGFTPTFGYGGLVSGDTAASVTYTGALYDNQNVTGASKVTVSGLSIASISGSHQSAASDYVLDATAKDVAASITPKSVTVTGLTVANKTYDGSTNASVINWGSVSTGVGSETLTLNGTGANFADPNANTGKTVTASYTLGSGNNTGLASNYQLSSNTATTTADISKALLTVIANNDAKFITQADASGYNGVVYSGFVNGETNAVLSGSVAITRSNAGTSIARSYNGVLVPDASGLTATNYSFQTQNGNYTVVGSNQLLVKVNSTSTTYGSAPSYTIADAEYYNGNAVVHLSSITDNGNGSFTVNDGAGGSATFTLTPINATLSGAGKTTVGSYQLGASGVTTTNAQNFNNSLAVVGSETVAAKGVSASASSGVSKTYDGTSSMTGISIALAGLETNDAVTVSGSGAFNTAHAGSSIGYTISNLALGSADANNYYLASGNSLSGNDGTIHAKTLTGTASIVGTLSKTYDGNTSATSVHVSGSVGGAVAGDTLTLDTSGVSLTYNSAHVVGANSIGASGSAGFNIASSASGSLASDYSFSAPTIATATGASITPATLTLSLANTGVTKTYDGTTAAPVGFTPSWNVVGFVTGDTAASVSNTGAAYNSKNVIDANKISVSGASLSSITGSRSSATSDYALASTSADVAANITPATVGLSASKTYDGTTDLTGAVSITTGIAGETLTYTAASANDAHVATAGKYINALTLTDQQAATSTAGGLASNYQLPTLDAAHAPVAINTKTLGATAAIGGTLSKSYDGTAMASGASVSGAVAGAVSGDTISLDASGVTLNYNSAHVVGANSISASGSAGYAIDASTHNSVASDYSFSAPTIAAATGASITPATLTLSLANTGVTKTYDGSISAPMGFAPAWSVVGFVTGDTAASVTSTGTAYNSKDVSTANKITVSGASLSDITGSRSSATSDYALAATNIDTSAAITAKSVTVSGLAVSNKTYDGSTNASVTNWGSVSTGVGSETLTLNGMGANFADPNANTGKTVTAIYTLANGSGNSAGLASNYQLSSNTATTTADINKALLTLIANNDAKFITQSDTTGYNGVSYSGFVHGETSTVLGGSVAITRSNAGTDSAGTYNGVLVPDASGLTATNYSFQTQNGNYTVVGANQLLVKVNSTSTTYGSAPSFTIADAAYYNGNAVVHLSSITNNGNGSFTINDGAGGSATFTLTPSNATLSSAGKTTVGSYQLDASGVTTANAQNFNNALAVVGSETVAAKGVSASVSGGVSKTYDGTASMNGVLLALNTVETNDVVGVSRSGSFISKNAGTGLAYTISDMALSGTDAGNYYLTNASGFSGSDGVITPKSVTLTPQSGSKVYDGHASANADLANLANLTSQLGIGGDNVSAATLSYNDKNVGTGKTLTLTAASINDGNNGGNYNLTLASNHSSEITRLGSVAWVGGSTGNWFDPANWAGGAVPDLANVANVVIPAGVTVAFDTSGVTAPADASGAVHIDGLRGSGGSLSQNSGTLDVGSGGIVLQDLTQSGGALSTLGSTTLASFIQTGGTTVLAQDLTVTQNFGQSGSGSVSVGGSTQITDNAGGVQLGNLISTGPLSVTSTDGAIVQSSGSAITAQSTGSFTAARGGVPADITLANAGNDLQGAVSLNGGNVAVSNGNALTLGVVTTAGDLTVRSNGALDLGTSSVGGKLNANSGDGNITQTGALTVGNTATLNAGIGTVALTDPGNNLAKGVTVTASVSNVVGDQVGDARSAATTAVAGIDARASMVGGNLSALQSPSPLSFDSAEGNSAGVLVELLDRPTGESGDWIAVSLPKSTAASGIGFTFDLPTSLTQNVPVQTIVRATLPNGSPLPDWLEFNAQKLVFTARAVPPGVLPLRVRVTIGSKQVMVTISERGE